MTHNRQQGRENVKESRYKDRLNEINVFVPRQPDIRREILGF